MTSTSTVRANPFYQPTRQWQIRIFVSLQLVPAVEETFDDLARAILSFEVDEETQQWRVEIITDVPPEEADIPSRLALASGLLNISTPAYEVEEVSQKNWAAEAEHNFPPFTVGNFYLYGSHVTAPPPHGKIPLHINAGAAFGSGEHATTSGCLLALTRLAKQRRFARPLDMGCGSGILAIAMAKLWRTPVLGIDVDPVSVTVARENARINQTHLLSGFYPGDGYNAPQVKSGAPFDIIVANILARPLVKMAPDLTQYLASGGVAVLSGLLVGQERMVLAAHRLQGLSLLFRIRQNGWSALVLVKR